MTVNIRIYVHTTESHCSHAIEPHVKVTANQRHFLSGQTELSRQDRNGAALFTETDVEKNVQIKTVISYY